MIIGRDISNKQLNCSGLKHDLSSAIDVYNLMFGAWLWKNFCSQEVELRKLQKELPTH
jgi:hypothetical protein